MLEFRLYREMHSFIFVLEHRLRACKVNRMQLDNLNQKYSFFIIIYIEVFSDLNNFFHYENK